MTAEGEKAEGALISTMIFWLKMGKRLSQHDAEKLERYVADLERQNAELERQCDQASRHCHTLAGLYNEKKEQPDPVSELRERIAALESAESLNDQVFGILRRRIDRLEQSKPDGELRDDVKAVDNADLERKLSDFSGAMLKAHRDLNGRVDLQKAILGIQGRTVEHIQERMDRLEQNTTNAAAALKYRGE
jgi:chromosome segregation ATPase